MTELKEVESEMRSYNDSGEMPMRWVTQVNIGIVIAGGRFVRLKTNELDIL